MNNPWTRRDFLKSAGAAGAALALTDVAPCTFAAEARREPLAAPAGKVRVGVIGCGNVSGSYLPDLLKRDFIEVISVCDIIPDRAQKRAEQFNLKHVYPHVDALLAGEPFDLLVNITSMPSHYAVNRKGLEAGKHVWSEKPMALEVKQGAELLALARKKGVRFWAAPNCVTSPQFRFMAETLAAGKLGKVLAAHGGYGHFGPGWSAWFCVAECLLRGKPTLITPEHGLHVLEVMNACHTSQRVGRRVKVRSTFPWPILPEA